MKLSIHTYQHQSLGYTLLQLGIAYTDGVLNEGQVSSAIQLGIDSIVCNLSDSVTRNANSRTVLRQRRVAEECTEGNYMDQIIEQILCEGVDVSTV